MSPSLSALLLGLLLSAPARAEEGPEDLDLVPQVAVEPLYSTLRFSSDGRQLVQTTESQRRVWDVVSGLLVEDRSRKSDPGDGSLPECAGDLEPCDARSGLLARAADEQLVVSRGGEEVLRCTLEVRAGGVALSPTGDRVAIAADDRLGILTIGGSHPTDGSCLDMADTGRPFPLFPFGGARLAFSPDGKLLAAGIEAGGYVGYRGERAQRRWGAPLQLLVADDLSVGRALGVRLEDPGDRLQISPDGARVLVYGAGLDGAQWDLSAASYGPSSSGMVPTTTGAMPAEQPELLAGAMGRWFATFDGVGLGIVSHNGDRFGAGDSLAPAAVLPPRGGGWVADANGDLLAVAGTCATIPSPNPGACNSGGPASELLLYDVRKGERARWTLPEGSLCEFADVAVESRDGSVLAIRRCDSSDGWKSTHEVVRLHPGHRGVAAVAEDTLPSGSIGLGFNRIAVAPDGIGLALATRDRVCLTVPRDQWEWESEVDTTYGTCVGVSPDDTGTITDIGLTKGGELLFILMASGVIEIYDPRMPAKVATLYPVGARDYAIVLPDGTYKATPAGLDLLAFREPDGDVLPASWLDPWLHQPGEVMEQLGYAAEAQVERVRQDTEVWRKRLGQRWVEDDERPVISVAGVELNEQDRTLRLDRIEVRGASESFTLEVRVNGVPWRGVGLSRAPGVADGHWVPLDIPLRVGSNRVDLVAVDALGRRSFPQRFEVLLPGVATRRVWFFGVAVETYDELKPLSWTMEDVHGLWEAIRGSANLPADNPAPFFLPEREVTREAVSALAARVAAADPDDLVILAVSGHGLSDDNGAWYFAPSELNPGDPGATGISYASLEAVFAETPALQRLLVIDACHAGPGALGGGGGGRGSRGPRATREVSAPRQVEVLPFLEHDRGVGVQALVASASWQVAWENDDRAGGLFTSALASGLSSFAADLDGDGAVTVDEWLEHAQREVEVFTVGSQRPTARAQSREGDFVVATGAAPSARRDLCVGAAQPLCGGGGSLVAIDGGRQELLLRTADRGDVMSRVSFDGRLIQVIPLPSLDLPVWVRQPPTLLDGVVRWGWRSTGEGLRVLERGPAGAWVETAWGGRKIDDDHELWIGSTTLVSWPKQAGGWGKVQDREGRLITRWKLSTAPRAAMANGDRVVALEQDGRLLVRALPSGEELFVLEGPFTNLIALSEDGRRLLAETSAGGFIEIDLEAGPPKLRSRPLDLGEARWIDPVFIGDDGTVTGEYEGTLLSWGAW